LIVSSGGFTAERTSAFVGAGERRSRALLGVDVAGDALWYGGRVRAGGGVWRHRFALAAIPDIS